MSGEGVCIDSNLITYAIGGSKSVARRLKGTTGVISVIAEIEALSYPDLEKSESEAIHEFIARCTVVGIADRIKMEAVRIRKTHGLKLPDAVVAATAIALNLTLLSADKVFFKLGDELKFEFVQP